MTATTETLEATAEPGRPSPWLRFGLAALLGLTGALLIGLGGLYVYDQLYAGKVLPGVSVGSVDMSGLTPDAARAELTRAYGSLSERPDRGRPVPTASRSSPMRISVADPPSRPCSTRPSPSAGSARRSIG